MKSLVWPAVTALATGLIMFFVGVWWTNRENRIQYLEYQSAASTDILKSIKEIGDSVDFVVNDKYINNLSELSIHLINSSNRDYENIPIYIDLHSPDGKDIRIFSSNYYDHNGSKESIEELTEVSRSVHSGGIRYGYNLKIVNRSSEPIFRVRYLVEGASVPNFEVQTNTKGVAIRQFVAKTENEGDFFNILLSSVMFALTIFILQLLRLQRQERKISKNIKEIEKDNEANKVLIAEAKKRMDEEIEQEKEKIRAQIKEERVRMQEQLSGVTSELSKVRETLLSARGTPLPPPPTSPTRGDVDQDQ